MATTDSLAIQTQLPAGIAAVQLPSINGDFFTVIGGHLGAISAFSATKGIWSGGTSTSGKMAPTGHSCAHASQFTARTDVCGLGAVLFAVVTGRAPFAAKYVQRIRSQITSAQPAPRLDHPEVPPEFGDICATCLAKDPSERFRSAEMLAERLESATG